MKKSNKYASIRSLSELRAERERVEWQKEIVSQKLDMNVQTIKKIFSFENLMLIVNEKIEMVRAFGRTVHSVVEYITSLFKRKPAATAEQPAEEQQQIEVDNSSENSQNER